jgi:predicted TIM-barrel fold metal-dependent hydrolase
MEMGHFRDGTGPYTGLIFRKDADLKAWLGQRPTEDALEPDLPIIDPHHHFWDAPHRGRYFLPDLLADIAPQGVRSHNIVATVFLECQAMYRKDGPAEMASVGEVEFVNGIAAMAASGTYGPCRVAEGIVGWADLMLGAGVRDVLQAQIAAGGGRFKGIRYGVAYDADPSVGKFASRPIPPHIVLDKTFREGFKQLAPLGLSFESWQYHPQLADAVDLARSFPETTMILNHVGGILAVGPYRGKRDENYAAWHANIKELAKCPNMNVKLGGVGMTHFGFDFHERDTPPGSADLAAAWKMYIEPCIEAFGVDRCMFESNFPPDKQSGGYTELWNAFKIIAQGATAAEKTALFSGTAARVYRLTQP